MKALILVKFASLATRDAYRLLRETPAVLDSSMVYGRYDAYAFIQGENLEAIRHVILSEVQTIPGVVETLPCILVEEEAPVNKISTVKPQSLRRDI